MSHRGIFNKTHLLSNPALGHARGVVCSFLPVRLAFLISSPVFPRAPQCSCHLFVCVASWTMLSTSTATFSMGFTPPTFSLWQITCTHSTPPFCSPAVPLTQSTSSSTLAFALLGSLNRSPVPRQPSRAQTMSLVLAVLASLDKGTALHARA